MNPAYESSLKPALSIQARNEDLRVVRQKINALIREENIILADIAKLEALL